MVTMVTLLVSLFWEGADDYSPCFGRGVRVVRGVMVSLLVLGGG